MKLKVAIIIPCYKAKNKVGIFLDKLILLSSKLFDICDITFFLVDDCCPDKSYREVNQLESIVIINNPKNVGVGAASLIGFKKALEDEYLLPLKVVIL